MRAITDEVPMKETCAGCECPKEGAAGSQVEDFGQDRADRADLKTPAKLNWVRPE